MVNRLVQSQLHERALEHRTDRLDLVARRLGAASTRAYKVTVHYHIPLLETPSAASVHLAGLHAVTGTTPHVYTTAGVYGDHEGPRSWLPCADSAAVQHRASHCLTVALTAPVAEGLSVVGCGEDFGATETILHDGTSNVADLQREVGTEHYQKIIVAAAAASHGSSQSDDSITTTPHVIPPDKISLDMILATTVWCSHTWTPIPCRSLGFAVGPFKVLEDPEYFGPSALDDKDDDDDNEDEKESFEERLAAFLDGARKHGEGIRQAYFAPLFERKHIHTQTGAAQTFLLPNTTLRLLPPTPQQRELAERLDQTLTFATTGVPHRALSLMRDVLALPVYRTASYTQIWIPNAVHGGCTSGALHCCPEVLVNHFLGGSIMDSRLLPPVGSRLPFYQGGRVLQFLQARCAVRGWITAALPLGGDDDVGNGYLFSLIESFVMSLYERGHGGQGEGMWMGDVSGREGNIRTMVFVRIVSLSVCLLLFR